VAGLPDPPSLTFLADDKVRLLQVTPVDARDGVGVFRVVDAITGLPCGTCLLTVIGDVADLDGRTGTVDQERRVHALLDTYCRDVLGVRLR
jgi:hypothetical protein